MISRCSAKRAIENRRTWHALPTKPFWHEQTPVPVTFMLHVPLPLQGVSAPPGQAAEKATGDV
jgi:hypothetical protein